MRTRNPAAVTRPIPTAAGLMLADATPAGITRLARVTPGNDDDEAGAAHADEPASSPATGPGATDAHTSGPAAVATSAVTTASAHLDRLSDQLDAYSAGELRSFDVPVDWDGAGVEEGFSREVYLEICEIPYGETASYGQISIDAGRPRNARRVGRLCSLVPVSFLIPVHRVIRADGGLGNCPGYRLRLLEHEQRNLRSAGPVAIEPV